MTDLESALRGRLTDSRAMLATLDINQDRVFLIFGAIGDLSRIVLRIAGNEVSVRQPGPLASAWLADDNEKRARKPDQPIDATLDGERLLAGPGGPEIFLPDAFFEALKASGDVGGGAGGDEPVKAVFDGEHLRMGDAGPIIEIPDDFIQAMTLALASAAPDAGQPADAENAAGQQPSDAGSADAQQPSDAEKAGDGDAAGGDNTEESASPSKGSKRK